MTIEQMQDQQALVARRMKLRIDTVERENRAPSKEEEQALAADATALESWDKRIERARGDAAMTAEINALTGGKTTLTKIGPGESASRRQASSQSAGALFAEGVGEFFKTGGHRSSGGWRSPAIEIPYASMFLATTLTEDPASGGKLVV